MIEPGGAERERLAQLVDSELLPPLTSCAVAELVQCQDALPRRAAQALWRESCDRFRWWAGVLAWAQLGNPYRRAVKEEATASPDGKTRTRLRRAIVMDMTPTSILPGAFSRCLTTVGRVLAWASHLKLAALLHRDQIAAAWSLQPVPGTSNTRPKPPCFPAPQETLSASVCRSIRGVAVATCVDGLAQSGLVSGLESIGAPIGPRRDWRVRGPNE